MAVVVVDVFEIVQVEKCQRKWALVALRPFEFPFQDRLHDPPVQQPCERVSNSQPLEPFMGNDIGKTDGDFDGELLEQLRVHSRPVAQGRQIRLVQAADDFTVKADR